MRQLIGYGIKWKRQAEDNKTQLFTLTEQYRQLANINKELREVRKVKDSKKK